MTDAKMVALKAVKTAVKTVASMDALTAVSWVAPMVELKVALTGEMTVVM